MRTTRYIVLGLLMTLALNLSARHFEAGEIMYVKMNPTNWNWYGNDPDAGKFAYFYNNSTSAYQWSDELIGVDWCNDVLQVNVPAGDWTHVIMTRNSVHTSPDWSNVFNNGDDNNVNKTENIQIPANQNYLENFRQYKDRTSHSGDMWYWMDHYFYRPTADPTSSTVTKIDQANRELVKVCKQSVGDPYSLQPQLVGSNYDYNQGRTWFKWVGGQWVELEHANHEWGYNGAGGLNETIGAANSHTYYFLATSDKSKERFIEIAVTEDCSPTCEITDFGVVTSNVNAHDSTYVLDGIVAFKDATGQTLRISVTDAKGEHHVDYVSPTTPFIFSLPGLYADGATGVVATASFLNTSYSRTSNPYNAPNAIMGITTNAIDKSYGETASLVPATDGSDGFKWHDGNTTDHTRVISAYDYDTTIIYTYYEYEAPPAVAGNLIENGDFSAAETYYGTINRTNTSTGSAISEYNFWGKDVTSANDFYDLYKDGTSSLFGGYSIVTDANAFWKRYTKKIAPKADTHYALFDADNSGEKKAWYVETGKSTNLTLAKGTNYMFSFWVANVNNYGEMNNAAKLQFAIRYKQGSTWSEEELLGNPIDLNNYQDNIWHQNSHVYTSPVDATEVEIMVRDLNTNSNPGGNDFALDDIRFQPISVVSQAIKNCERFVVTIFEPAITVSKPVVTITQTPACGKTDFTMQVKVSYSTLNNMFPVTLQLTDDIYGDLFATPITINPATNPNDTTITLSSADYPMLVADGQTHTLIAKLTRINGAGVDKGGQNSCTYVSPGVPAIKTPVLTDMNILCGTYDLQVATEYFAFKGTRLHYEWDGVEWTDTVSPSLSYDVTNWQTAIGKLMNLVPDGATHTLRVYSDNALDCEYTFTSVLAATAASCEKKDTTICEGNTVNWMGGTYPTTPYIGTDTFTSGYDSLILTIKALPRITVGTVSMVCDSASEVRIPFTVSTGTPDTYDIAVDGVHYAGKVIGSDLVFSPTTMVAGDYTATLTVSETGLGCESTVTSSFTIALSGHLYSKWTDVLFVSNADGRFVSYQWFADGVAMPGETMQRLYDPKGLSGTTTLYQCRMNTTDGKTIYTCPQTFDDATPSRTKDTGSSAPIKKIYDTMGRPVNGTPAQGIYIVVMEIDGEQVTSKMLIHD